MRELNRRIKLFSECRYNAEHCFTACKPLHTTMCFQPMSCQRQQFLQTILQTMHVPATDIFTLEFLTAWRGAVKASNDAYCSKHDHNERFQVDVFHKAFCAIYADEIEPFKKWNLPHQFQNHMNRGGCIFNEIGLARCMDRLTHCILVLSARQCMADYWMKASKLIPRSLIQRER
eukprot:gb/GFBE01064871.1/.p1 GENE.gb/GFBE01064871.1/~~gb/GFBE01064871.1/.p1  ORF type:complete len:175 (+),score=18.37 gb/GFBE01064871.1/:1-525(+)